MTTHKKSTMIGKFFKTFVAYQAGKGFVKALVPTLAVSGIGLYLYRRFSPTTAARTS